MIVTVSSIHMKGQKPLHPVRVNCRLENSAHNVGKNCVYKAGKGWIFDKCDFNGNACNQHSAIEQHCGRVIPPCKELSSVSFYQPLDMK